MTNLGATQLFSSGGFYRQRYIDTDSSNKIFNISSTKASPSQIWVSAPDQSVLLQTAVNFLQGLYPPLSTLDTPLDTETLNNDTKVEAPLGGYQFVQIHGESEDDPDTIWIKGDDSCPTYDKAAASYKQSTEFNNTLKSSRDFYSQFIPQLGKIMGNDNVSYAHAYEVFDLLNVGNIHNASIRNTITSEQLDQLRYYANQHEWAQIYNKTQPERSIGGSALMGGILRQLNETVAGKAKLKFNLMTGSYDTFQAFFGLANLSTANPDFIGLPNYGASMAFELFTEDNMTSFPSNTDDLRVRFLFRNGTESDKQLTTFPLFGQQETILSYNDFVAKMNSSAITSPGQWCSTCRSTDSFCAAYPSATAISASGTGLTVTAAGVIGAMTTLGVLLLGGLVFWLVRRRRRSSRAKRMSAATTAVNKERAGSDLST